MLTRITIIALCLAPISGLSQAYAADPTGMYCQVRDRAGSNSSYFFAIDTKNASGADARLVSGTLAETEFIDNDGNAKFFAQGQRPAWLYTGDERGGLTLWSSTPGWAIVLGAISNNHGDLGAEAWLYHDRTAMAAGGCIPVPAKAQ
jgi:hypothetical protein